MSAFSRRTLMSGVGAAGVAVALAPSSTAATTGPVVGRYAYVRVNATTSWLKPGTARAVDARATSYPPSPQTWLDAMTYTQEKGLVGLLDTQAPLNSKVLVRAISGTWARVSFLDQKAPNSYGYMTSWVPASHVVTDTVMDGLKAARKIARVTADKTTVYSDAAMTRPLMVIPFNTELPYADGYTWSRARVYVAGRGWAYVRRSELSLWAAPVGTAAQTIATAKRFLGRRYLWAGTTSFGFDCSGFTYSVLRANGIAVCRDSGPQLNDSGLPRVARANLQPGDLVFWATAPGSTSIRHVALYLGGGRIIHAPNVGSTVQITSLNGAGVADYAGAVRPRYRR